MSPPYTTFLYTDTHWNDFDFDDGDISEEISLITEEVCVCVFFFFTAPAAK